MGYTFKTVRKPYANAGAGQSVNPDVIMVKRTDILNFPDRDKIDRIRIEGNIILKPGARAFRVYMTPSTHNRQLSTEGDADARAFVQHFEAWHPGDDEEIAAYAQNALNEHFILIHLNCKGNTRRVWGDPCNPLVCTASFEGTNEKTGWTFVFEQEIREGFVPAYYYGELPKTDPFVVTTGTSVKVEKNKGPVYQLAPANTTADLALDNLDFEHGTIVTLLGGGGDNPYELKEDTQVMLENGSAWIGLRKSVIHLRIFKTSSGTIFVETGRS